ncbi:MAG: class I SAM-dependent methyltransferase [Candidatus Electryoneaceae bacterium]|nr:class I SAM-dependent methyltransferase [Candidatus Electryoneaceae bacterium]
MTKPFFIDDIAKHNYERWEALAKADIAYSRPFLNLDRNSAYSEVDPEGKMCNVQGKNVLCLAGGGGQQSVAFGILGANVTVLDISETQLQRDKETAAHYGLDITLVQGDMRDLSGFDADAFDLIWHAHSLGFVPDARQVFSQVARVLKINGQYRLSCHNPFPHGMSEDDWNGEGYTMSLPYVDGEEIIPKGGHYWEFEDACGRSQRVLGPHEFRHTLSTLINGQIEIGFQILGLWEDGFGKLDAEPGSWNHFTAVVPPYLVIWSQLLKKRE